MKRVVVTLLALVIGVGANLALADDINLESAPPVVVKTVPEAGADEVDPKLSEIKVTFSKNMQDGSWSWETYSKESFPKTDGKAKYLADRRT